MRSAAANRLLLIGLLAAAAGLYLLGNSRVPLWDRDEPRYAECSREMLQSGDWVVPRFLGEWRAHKPPLVYWGQVIAMEMLGNTAPAARLPSALAVLLTAAMLGAFVRRQSDWPTALWSVAVFCTCVLTIGAAKVCITDAILLLWIVIGQGCLLVIWRNRGASLPVAILFWISVGIAGMTKGPVVLWMHLVTLLVLAALDGRAIAWWRKLRPIAGVGILIVIVSPWLILVHQRAPGFLTLLFSRASRYAGGGAEGHAQWPGFYLLTIWVTMFPWSLLLPTAIVIGFRRRNEPLTRFALAASIGPWLAMELVTNKLPFYILPSFPALAVLTALVIVGSPSELKHRVFMIGVVIWAAAVAALAVAPILLFTKLGEPQAISIAWLIAAVIYLMAVFAAVALGRVQLATATIAGGMALLSAIAFGALLPNLPPLTASRSVGQDLVSLGAGGQTNVAMIDFREPSLAFYQGGGARESDYTALGAADSPDWAVITTESWDHLKPTAQDRYRIVTEPREVLRYNDGWRVSKLIVIRKK